MNNMDNININDMFYGCTNELKKKMQDKFKNI